MEAETTFTINRAHLQILINHVSEIQSKNIKNLLESLKTLIYESDITFIPHQEILLINGIFRNHNNIRFNYDKKSKIFTSSTVIEKTNYFIVAFEINNNLRLDFLHDTTAHLSITKKRIIKEYSLKRDIAVFNSKP